ncbi:MAG: hypothetical protein D3908_12540, partial [Candidatus Electrothrix sp. AUS4]|nr:hypothetical protein [Candidatus Electrothrix sp. AUS4]
ADITLELLNRLTLEGKSVIDTLHQEAQREVKKRMDKIENQIKEARELQAQGIFSHEDADKEIEIYKLLQRANERCLDAWKEVLARTGNQEDFLKSLEEQKKLISYKRNQAEVQLETLRGIRQLSELRDVIGNLDALASSVSKLELLRLDEETVRDLLGYNGVIYDPKGE